jgi:quinol monooxygenase YgiN
MLKIVAKCDVKESEKAKFIQNATQLVNKSRDDAGCLSYELFHDLEKKNIYFFLEEWRSDVFVKYHEESEYFKIYFSNILQTLNQEIEVYKTQKSI